MAQADVDPLSADPGKNGSGGHFRRSTEAGRRVPRHSKGAAKMSELGDRGCRRERLCRMRSLATGKSFLAEAGKPADLQWCWPAWFFSRCRTSCLRGTSIVFPASSAVQSHLTLLICMMGGAIAAREGRLLALSTVTTLLKGTVQGRCALLQRRLRRGADGDPASWPASTSSSSTREAATDSGLRISELDSASHDAAGIREPSPGV